MILTLFEHYDSLPILAINRSSITGELIRIPALKKGTSIEGRRRLMDYKKQGLGLP